MSTEPKVIEYKCPCCGAGLLFRGDSQQLTCEYCDNSFDLETVRAFNASESQETFEEFQWDQEPSERWSDAEESRLNVFICPSCGGEIMTEETTAASFCPYCDNPTIMPGRLSGGMKPDAIIPFRMSKEDAKEAFRKLCKGKPLLPGMFTKEQRIEKITGIYVPFWLYDCCGNFDGNYNATRIHTWADANYNYTRTEHFLLKRGARADFQGIPMDGSSKMDNTLMESIEPFDYSQLQNFDMAFLSGYLADKYDVPSDQGKQRVKERVENAFDAQLQSSFLGYSTVVPTSCQLKIDHSKARYALMPVWILNTRYRGKLYTFAMNGQTGRMTGSFPISPQKCALWFGGIFAGVTLLATLVQMVFR
ncbi:MAG: hypothetical protein SPE19_03270 [Candidatus Faecousia sp.]|nr:hypothetical protein [Candidatus Faecousia sp.]